MAIPPSVAAVSFDLWDTLVIDGSDEAKRLQRGLRHKLEDRRRLLWQAVCRQGDMPLEAVNFAYNAVDAACNKVWHDEHVTWPVVERLRLVLRGLGRELPEAELAALVVAHETMELEVPPDLIAGVTEALTALAGRYKLCVVSDAVFTPGRVLRQLLAHHGLAKFFEVMIFSDEVGRSKPDRLPFERAAQQLGVALPRMVHIGDRQHTDVAGAQAAGMRAVLLTVARDKDRASTSADAICDRYPDLVAIIDTLAKKVKS